MSQIEIKTDDGICPSYVYRPSGDGPWPAVLLYMDGIGIRPAMLEVGERLATYGYFVLLPDLFYRSGPYEPMDAQTVFSDPEKRKVLMEKFFALATQASVMSDTGAFLDYLAVQPDVIAVRGAACAGNARAGSIQPDRVRSLAQCLREDS